MSDVTTQENESAPTGNAQHFQPQGYPFRQPLYLPPETQTMHRLLALEYRAYNLEVGMGDIGTLIKHVDELTAVITKQERRIQELEARWDIRRYDEAADSSGKDQNGASEKRTGATQ